MKRNPWTSWVNRWTYHCNMAQNDTAKISTLRRLLKNYGLFQFEGPDFKSNRFQVRSAHFSLIYSLSLCDFKGYLFGARLEEITEIVTSPGRCWHTVAAALIQIMYHKSAETRRFQKTYRLEAPQTWLTEKKKKLHKAARVHPFQQNFTHCS